MREHYIPGIAFLCLSLVASAHSAAQSASPKPVPNSPKIESELLTSIGIAKPKLTPVLPTTQVKSLPVKVLYDGPMLKGEFDLEITLSKIENLTNTLSPQPVSKSTIYLTKMTDEIDAVLNIPEQIDGLQIYATLRDSNQNLVLQTPHHIPVLSLETRLIRLSPIALPELTVENIPNFTAMERISGQISLPRNARIPRHSTLHVQLLENALAGGLSMELVTQTAVPAIPHDGALPFTLQRGLWDRPDTPDLAFKAWITDGAGRKIFVMQDPTGYNGPQIEYSIPLIALKQGRDTQRGLNLRPELMAQTLIQGEAAFDPTQGIPGQARLSIKLKQDRGDFNRNPILAEQTLILRGMETRIPFTLTTDSTHFDPYAPAPFLSVSLIDVNGRVYYASGDIRAREDNNLVRLYPR